jgi:hypothetical protein
MATWDELEAELALWRAAGEAPTFWWRDDDVEEPTADLDRLIALADRFRAPLHLAAVPRGVGAPLKERLEGAPGTLVLQHGLAHRNHEPKPARASEVGVNRKLSLQEADLREGWRLLTEAGLPRLLPVFVPPWNRIADKTLPHLPGWGFPALSNFDRRPSPSPVADLQIFNGHIDPIRWKEGARFAGTEKTLEQCLRHLRQRRTGEADRDEPTGLVTHHLQTDEATWDFTEAFMERVTRGGSSRWIALSELMNR